VWQLLALGVSGGMAPCPSALVDILSAVALGRIWFGLMLVTAFSMGLATVLVAAGLLTVWARRWFDRLPEGGLVSGAAALGGPAVTHGRPPGGTGPGRLAEGLPGRFPHLRRLMEARGPGDGGTPLPVAAVAYFFRREVAADPELSRELAFAKLDAVRAGQEAAFAAGRLAGSARRSAGGPARRGALGGAGRPGRRSGPARGVPGLRPSPGRVPRCHSGCSRTITTERSG
jgi:hypothetical protein